MGVDGAAPSRGSPNLESEKTYAGRTTERRVALAAGRHRLLDVGVLGHMGDVLKRVGEYIPFFLF